jgi:hypothetical protein
MLAVKRTRSMLKDWGTPAETADRLHGQPEDELPARPALGRRMGGDLGDLPRHGRGLHGGVLGIYVLVVAQFGSFKLPLVILTPVPLTFIGIIIGHGFSARRSRRPR